MKKTSVSTVSLLLALCLAGCANPSSPDQKTTAPAPSHQPAPGNTAPAQTAPTQTMPAQTPTTTPAAQDPFANVQVLKKTYQPTAVPPGDKLDLSYPEVSGLPDAAVQKRINDFLKEKAVPQKVDVQTDMTTIFKVQYLKGKILNLLLTGYVYPHGAAHGMPIQDSYILNLENGASYTLQDLFKPGSGYLDRLTKLVKEDDVTNVLSSFSPFPGVKNDDSFYLDASGFTIYYQPYEYTPYAVGFPAFRVSFHDVADLINQDGDFWKAFQTGGLSQPSAEDFVYADYKKDASVILSKGYTLANSLLAPAATVTDGSGNRLYAWFADRGTGYQVFFFLGDTFLGTDTAKSYNMTPIDASSNGKDAITITYDSYENNTPGKFSVTYTWAGGKLTPDANFAKLAQ